MVFLLFQPRCHIPEVHLPLGLALLVELVQGGAELLCFLPVQVFQQPGVEYLFYVRLGIAQTVCGFGSIER